MLYTRRSFTCPASSNTSQMRWDLAFMSPEEFKTRYQMDDTQYDELLTKKF